MACFSPLAGYRSRTRAKTGGYGIVFKKSQSNGQLIQIKCGNCIGCRLDKTAEWAIRCVHEAQMHTHNCFITLTYNNNNIPRDGSLDKSHFQDFIKRLRKNNKHKIRYYMCGEYGEKLTRPHYHAILFGHNFPDKLPYQTENQNQLYISQDLENTWQNGYCAIGEMTFESAAYCARYTIKKINGKKASNIDPTTGLKHYENMHQDTGEITTILPEYTNMSLRPGIGNTWYNKYKNDLFPEDECIIDGRKHKPPRYYTKKYQQEEPKLYETMKKERKRFFAQHTQDATWQRLATREQVKIAEINQLTRQLEKQQ